MINKITINCDVGEGISTDAEVMSYIDSANIACGAHAGSTEIIRQTINLAKLNNVIIGAHPGYEDREHFGRLSLNLSDEELYKSISKQLQLFKNICGDKNVNIDYVKPHGALSHDMLFKKNVLKIICKSMLDNDIRCSVMIPICQQTEMIKEIVKIYSLDIIWEVFADRAYENNGLLRSRKLDGALYNDKQKIITQFKNIIHKQLIQSYYGRDIDVSMASSVCVHGDNYPSILAVKEFS